MGSNDRHVMSGYPLLESLRKVRPKNLEIIFGYIGQSHHVETKLPNARQANNSEFFASTDLGPAGSQAVVTVKQLLQIFVFHLEGRISIVWSPRHGFVFLAVNEGKDAQLTIRQS
jgi:hypothetical protein